LKKEIAELKETIQQKRDGWLRTNQELNIEIETHAQTRRKLSAMRAELNALLIELGRPLHLGE
jgi:hypothetical protein